jgi:hypothetical protein
MTLVGQYAPALHWLHAAVKLEPPGENVPAAQGFVVPAAWPLPHQ